MKDKELRIYEILYGGICMSLPIFLCPGELSPWRLLLPMAAAFCLYEAALRRKSILLYLLIWIVFGAAAFEAGRDLIEKVCLTGGIVFGGAACFYGRWKGDYLFLGGPALPMLAVPAVAYLIAHVEKMDYIKGRVCIFAALVILLRILCGNRERLLAYLKENEKLHRFPKQRLETRNRHVMIFFGVFLTLAMIAAYWKAPADPEFTKSENTPDMTFTMEQFEPSGGMEMDLSGLLGDDEVYEPPAWVTALENILYYVVTIALIVGFIALVALTVYKILKAYRNRYEKWTPEEKTEGGDVTESLAPPKIILPKFFRKKTPAEQIRKYYRKWVLGGPGQTPANTNTPEEAERNAGVADETAHLLYEKARYSRAECRAEDAAYLKKLS